jgi:hypothetical protein
MLTFISGMLFDMATEEPISSWTHSDGKASSGWLLVEVGERYIQARLVTATLHKVNRTIHPPKIHFYIKIWRYHYIRMQWNVFRISATSIYNKIVILNNVSVSTTRNHPLLSLWLLLELKDWYLLCIQLPCTYQFVLLIMTAHNNRNWDSHQKKVFIPFWCSWSSKKTSLHLASFISLHMACHAPQFGACQPLQAVLWEMDFSVLKT